MMKKHQGTAKQPSQMSSKTAFKTMQQTAISKLPPANQAFVNAKKVQNGANAASAPRPVNLPPQKGKITADTVVQHAPVHHGSKGNQQQASPTQKPVLLSSTDYGKNGTSPNNPQQGTTTQKPVLLSSTAYGKNGGQNGQQLGTQQSGHKTYPMTNPFSTLGAANTLQTGSKNAALGGFIAGTVIGAIGDAIVLGAGAFGQGGLSYPGGGGGGYIDDGSGGDCSSPFDSGCVYVPNGDASQPFDPNADGSGVVMAVDSPPAYDDAAAGNDAGSQGNSLNQQIQLASATSTPNGDSSSQTDVSPTVTDGTAVPIDSVPQSGRYLNVVNLSSSRATFHIKYHAVDQTGNWNWFPSAPNANDDALSFDLEPGQAVELWDGSWHVYADKARIWATSTDSRHQWERYKTSDLLLVSEQDDQGQPSYLSPNTQTLSFGLK